MSNDQRAPTERRRPYGRRVTRFFFEIAAVQLVGYIDILPALKREDSPVGRRAVRRDPEGNFLPDGSTGFVSTTSGRWARDDASPLRTPPLVAPHTPGRPTATGVTVRTHTFGPVLSTEPTRVVPSTELHRTASAEWATANGAGFGVPSPPRLRGRCRPSPVTGRGTARTTNESEPRTPRRVCHRRAWNRPYRREAAPNLPIDTLRDWLGIRHDASRSVAFGCVAGRTARIPALKGEALRLFSRNNCNGLHTDRRPVRRSGVH